MVVQNGFRPSRVMYFDAFGETEVVNSSDQPESGWSPKVKG